MAARVTAAAIRLAANQSTQLEIQAPVRCGLRPDRSRQTLLTCASYIQSAGVALWRVVSLGTWSEPSEIANSRSCRRTEDHGLATAEPAT